MSPSVNVGIVISILLFQAIKIPAMPVRNGFNVKFNPEAAKEEIKPKTFGSLFAKTSQGLTPRAQLSQTILTQGLGCTNQIARHFSIESNSYNTSGVQGQMDMITIPILKLNETYKLVVVKAPKDFRIGKRSDSDRAIIYILFADADDTDALNIPEIYFVKKSTASNVLDPKFVDPVIIVDHNRTITGLRSAEITKFVKFKSKRNNRDETQEVIKR